MRGPSMGKWLLSRRDGRTLALAGRRKNEVEGKQEVRRRSTDAELWRTAFIGLASKPRSVQSSRWDGTIFLLPPGTSCLATIMLSLWDKIHSPRRGFHYA